jgi:hypothetical protein
MANYIKKPMQIEAVPYKEGMEDGFAAMKVRVPCDCICHKPGMSVKQAVRHIVACCDGGFNIKSVQAPFVYTKRGMMLFVMPGDMIITEEGERYPMDAASFKQKYIEIADPNLRTNPSTNFMAR